LKKRSLRRPNVVFLLADQWRAQATGYAGDPNAVTGALDALAKESVNFTNAVSGCPVCCPYRASLLTGQYPLTHGVFMNDVPLATAAVSIAEVYKSAGYDTAYIGKWHVNAHGRSNFIPKDRRQGFEYWKVLECTHEYNNSYYYADENVKLKWQGYDAIAQTADACQYITSHAKGKPFLLVLSWGPPHSPYQTAPQKYKDLFKGVSLSLRPNVPADRKERARRGLAGYYAHIAALDDCVGRVVDTLKQCGLEKDTILVFTSDHGDMLHSHGQTKKQRPWDESIMVPLLLRYPAILSNKGRMIDMPINTPDIMPTLLGLSSIEIPKTVEGKDFSNVVTGVSAGDNEAALITCPAPFGQWQRKKHGGREYRGIRTRRYTHVRDLTGPWLLYDNMRDPYQLHNLCNDPDKADLQRRLDDLLTQKLDQTKDEFLPAQHYITKWSYIVDETGTVPYTR
jgi:arylsulfatase A-like enzyme